MIIACGEMRTVREIKYTQLSIIRGGGGGLIGLRLNRGFF
jgi:hypothetical protein